MKTKQKNNKILPATSACCGAVVRNECMNHFSKLNKDKNFPDNSCITWVSFAGFGGNIWPKPEILQGYNYK